MSLALAPRVVMIVVALGAIFWLGLGFRHERRLADAARVNAQPLASPAEIDRALELLHATDWATPHETRAESVRAALHQRDGRIDLAEDAMDRVVENEPENAEAWVLVATFNQGRDPEQEAEALDRLDQLDPVNAEARRRLFR